MKGRSALFLILSFACLAFSQQSSTECTSTANSTNGVQPTQIRAPTSVFYMIIGANYYSDMVTGYNLLKQAAEKHGSTATMYHLSSTAGVIPDLDNYDQVWVADLSAALDDSAAQMASYAKISAWYRAKGNPHLICDGRWISSLWSTGQNPFGMGVNHARPERQLVENYFIALNIRGGGLALLTDHWAPNPPHAFVDGINYINRGIGIGDFTGYFYAQPFLLEADTASSLMTYPAKATHHDRNGVTYLWDDSSTADSPIGAQSNGIILYPIGWHAEKGTGTPGISTTIRGSVGFLISIRSPTCLARFSDGTSISFDGVIQTGGQAPFTWKWISDKDGDFGTTQTLTKVLSIGRHKITLRVVDAQRLVAEAYVTIVVVFNSGSPTCYVSAVNAKTDVTEIFPIQRTATSTDYYSYNTPVAKAANTADKLETLRPRSASFFFYDDGTTLSLFHIVGNPSDVLHEQLSFKIDAPSIAGSGADITLRDDPNDRTVSWDPATGLGTADFDHRATTSGFVLGPLPRNSNFCLRYTFRSNATLNLDSILVDGHEKPSPAYPSTMKILTFQYPLINVQTLDLCRTTCNCPRGPVEFTALKDDVYPLLVQFGPIGAVRQYNDQIQCTWAINPTPNPSGQPIAGIAIYFDAHFDVAAGDSVTIVDGGSVVHLAPTSNGPAPAPVKVFAGNFTAPATVSFSVNNDGRNGDGWKITYIVVPTAVTVTPNRSPTVQKTPVNITGYNVINTPDLMCLFDNQAVPGVYVDTLTVACEAPTAPAAGTFQVRISNDGGRTWSNPLPFIYFDATCASLTDCAACLSKPSCNWCNHPTPSQSQCFAVGGGFTCPGVVDTTCCTTCLPLNGCNNAGQCLCNNTCNCNPTATGAACQCLQCPIGLNGTVCSGRGDCNCSGVCDCKFGFTGPACECLTCEGQPPCSGNGQCQCDGTCACSAGWTSSNPLRPICDCSLTCPKNCSNHGTCKCGVCQCDPGWAVLADCSCAEKCPNDCSLHGTCDCDGKCSCLPGYSGPDCSFKSPCDYANCTACTADTSCGWCGGALKCENLGEIRSCSTSSILNPLNFTLHLQCPNLGNASLVTVDFDTTPVIAGGIVAAIIAILIAVIAAIFISRRPPKSGILATGEIPSDDAFLSSPLFEKAAIEGESGIYEAGRKR